MTKYYLAGPMRDIPHLNFPAFMDTSEALEAKGYGIYNPARASLTIHGFRPDLREPSEAELDILASVPYEEYMGHDLNFITSSMCEGVFVLEGWEKSQGAREEVRLARFLKKPVYSAEHVLLQGELKDAEVFESFEDNPLRQRQASGGVKDNMGKARVDLIPAAPLELEGEVLAYGARKYKPDNWRLGLAWSDTMASLLRHLYAFQRGEDIDPETTLPHLGHAMCQLSFLTEYYLTKTGTDDRWSSRSDEDKEAAKA